MVSEELKQRLIERWMELDQLLGTAYAGYQWQAFLSAHEKTKDIITVSFFGLEIYTDGKRESGQVAIPAD